MDTVRSILLCPHIPVYGQRIEFLQADVDLSQGLVSVYYAVDGVEQINPVLVHLDSAEIFSHPCLGEDLQIWISQAVPKIVQFLKEVLPSENGEEEEVDWLEIKKLEAKKGGV